MSRTSNRPRRIASKRQIAILRTLGWRYSASRGAWVHRALGGRVGPVYCSPDEIPIPQFDDSTIARFDLVRAPVLPEHDIDPLSPEVAQAPVASEPLPQRPRAAKRQVIQVEAQLHESEPARVVMVDGRPPRRGIDPRALRLDDGVVVPIKSARAATA